MGVIAGVDPGSIAEALGIEAGDRLLAIDGKPVSDVIDYQYMCAEDAFRVEVEKLDGSVLEAEVRLEDYGYAPMGLRFHELVFDCERRCANKCVFCFIDQLPKGLRSSLYFKDDDYRLSLLEGNFVTLTNVSEMDLQRIEAMKLSPLYVSVHAADEEVRRKLLGRKRARPIMPTLKRLASAGIEIHAQVVLVPGHNDGAVLEATLEQLTALWPAVASVGVVPVGLTRHRLGLPDLSPVTADDAKRVIDVVVGYRHTYTTDEFYFLAGLPVPPADAYDDYPQLENGIGLARTFLDDFGALEPALPEAFKRPVRLIVVTGVLGAKVIGDACERLNSIRGLRVDVLPVVNRFFGPNITVTGLVVGQDIAEEVRTLRETRATESDVVLVPDVMLRRGGDVFLDDMRPEQLESIIGLPLMVTEATAQGMVDAVTDLAGGVSW